MVDTNVFIRFEKSGRVRLPKSPGLGVRLTEEVLNSPRQGSPR